MKSSGRGFRITKNEATGYSYLAPNPGVYAIASINGRGAYKKRAKKARAKKARSARSEMSSLSQPARKRHAKRTVARLIKRRAKRRPAVRSTSRKRSTRSSSKRKTTMARRARRRGRRLSANRRRSLLRNLRKVRKGKRRSACAPKRRKSAKRKSSRGRRKSHVQHYPGAVGRGPSSFRKKGKRRRAVSRRRKAEAVEYGGHQFVDNRSYGNPWVRSYRGRRGKAKRKRCVRIKRYWRKDRSKKMAANRRRRYRNPYVSGYSVRGYKRKPKVHSYSVGRYWRKKRGMAKNRRRHRRHRMMSNRRYRRHHRMSSNRRYHRRHRMMSNRRHRRHYRANGRYNMNRRRHHRGRYSMNRRRHHRRHMRSNRHRRYRRNPEIMKWLKTGAFIAGGLMVHKLVTGIIKNLLVSGTPTVADTTATTAAETQAAPAPTSGILPTALAPYSALIAGGIAAAGGVFATNKLVKNNETRALLAGGIMASFVHTVLITLLKQSPTTAKYAEQMSGLGSSGAATRMSAMYGLGTSIMPMYAPAPTSGFGEYFDSGVAGLGEYFDSGVAGLGAYQGQASAGMGEYFDSGVAGLGEYGANPDIYQAAAGYGAVETSATNHVDPGSNLDRELSIAEAAAGVGNLPPMQAAAGLGGTVGTSQTWIPGESNPPIWAGVRGVTRDQASTAQIPAGILESGGGQGVFG